MSDLRTTVSHPAKMAAVFLLLAVAPVFAQTAPGKFTFEDFQKVAEESRLSPLRGRPIPYFEVVVEKEIQSRIDRDGLKTEAELILRRNGVPLLGKIPDASPWGFLYLRIDAVRSGPVNGGYAYAVRVSLELSEEVSIKRQGETAATMVAPTWQDWTLLFLGEARLQAVRETSRAMIERFCLDYVKANPK